jgi:MOSC domain-containing protein YiiM
MKIVSTNVGRPREIEWRGRVVRTSIFKAPVFGPVRVRKLNLDGDEQSDLSVHGGLEKAVYVYPAEHYDFWRDELPEADLSWGAFGENFTTEGLFENSTHIGDRLRVGEAEFRVTQPRMPCYKLGIRFGRPDILKRFLRSGRTGFYLAVLSEGEVAAGDSIEVVERDEHEVRVSDVTGLYTEEGMSAELLQKVSDLPALPAGWRDYFRRRIHDPKARR